MALSLSLFIGITIVAFQTHGLLFLVFIAAKSPKYALENQTQHTFAIIMLHPQNVAFVEAFSCLWLVFLNTSIMVNYLTQYTLYTWNSIRNHGNFFEFCYSSLWCLCALITQVK